MRSLAAMRVQEAEHALCGIRRYAEMMLAAIGAGLLLVPEPAAGTHPERRRRALILCMSELGFVGEFNTRLADAAKAAIEPEDQLFILGSRGAELAIEHGLQIAWSAPIATRPRGAPETVHVLADELYRRIAQSGISRVEAMFGRHSGGVPAVQRQLLLPLDLAAFAAIQRGLHFTTSPPACFSKDSPLNMFRRA
jgi:F-type H+-transporting ATPase subunit gamma